MECVLLSLHSHSERIRRQKKECSLQVVVYQVFKKSIKSISKKFAKKFCQLKKKLTFAPALKEKVMC